MPQYPYIMEAIDVRRANQPGTSRQKIIQTLALPALTKRTNEHTAGGSVMGLNLSFPQLEPLEPKFSTGGFDLDSLRKFGFAAGLHDKWIFAGSIRIRRGAVVPGRAVIEGVINTWEPDESTPGELMKCNHTIVEVTHYELLINNEELFYVDDDENVARSGGQDWFRPTRRALGI